MDGAPIFSVIGKRWVGHPPSRKNKQILRSAYPISWGPKHAELRMTLFCDDQSQWDFDRVFNRIS
jgi:hypothetical protein